MERRKLELFILFFLMLLFLTSNALSAVQVTLTWDPNSEPDLAGYKIYYGTADRAYQWNIDVGNVTSYTVTGLQSNILYYFAATAYNTQGLESGFSNQVLWGYRWWETQVDIDEDDFIMLLMKKKK
jgi:hypothetical protein